MTIGRWHCRLSKNSFLPINNYGILFGNGSTASIKLKSLNLISSHNPSSSFQYFGSLTVEFAKSCFFETLSRHCKAIFCRLSSAVVRFCIRFEIRYALYSTDSLCKALDLLSSSKNYISFVALVLRCVLQSSLSIIFACKIRSLTSFDGFASLQPTFRRRCSYSMNCLNQLNMVLLSSRFESTESIAE